MQWLKAKDESQKFDLICAQFLKRNVQDVSCLVRLFHTVLSLLILGSNCFHSEVFENCI